jgi:hypothetical protein
MVRARLASLMLSDGTRVKLADPGITVIVGPNNSGKTLLLREIALLLDARNTQPKPKLLSSLEVIKEGSADELLDWLKQQGVATPDDPRAEYQTSYRRHGSPLPEHIVRDLWDRAPTLGALVDLLLSNHATDSRLQLLGGISVPNLYNRWDDTTKHPLQALYTDREATANLSELVERAFGVPITLNRYGTTMQLHWGVPSEPESLPPPSRGYIDSLLSLPTVSEQGDGVRSFVGLLLHTMVPMPLVLIDEPEAFLHPPHARLLGRLLVERTPEDGQLIMATHSDDVLQGVLEVRHRPVRVIRLTREGDHATMRTLDPADIRKLWGDPLIRHSQLLDGLFHDAVLVCEADSDCRFYAAVFDELRGNDYGAALLITHCGGKQRLPKAVRAVAQFGVRVGVIADLDVLNDAELLKQLVQAVGGDWAAFERDQRIISSAVKDLGRAPSVTYVGDQLGPLLAGKDGKLDDATAKKIRDLVTVQSGWQEIKRGGLASLPGGDPMRAAQSLLRGLGDLGLFLVPVGELERWMPEVGGRGSEWVSRVLEDKKHLPLRAELRDFGRRVLSYLDGTVITTEVASSGRESR